MTRVKSLAPTYVFCLLICYFFVFLLKAPTQAYAAMVSALELCFLKVVPVLFPFLVLNELIVNSPIPQYAGKSFGGIFSKVFKTSNQSSIAFLCGCLLGFPIGTKCVCSMLKNNTISKNEAQRLICFCSNTGPAFVVGFLGALWGIKTAWCIYFCQILSAVIIGIHLRKKHDETEVCFLHPQQFSPLNLTRAITSSVLPMLNICAFVCFFSCISTSVNNIILHLGLNEYTEVFFSGLLEISNGINSLGRMEINTLSVWLGGFFVGWSGFSVILQSVSIIKENNLKCRKFVFYKLVQGVICANLSILCCELFNLY